MENKSAIIVLAEGFEEVEAFAPVDLLRRAGVHVMVAASGNDTIVCGAHGIKTVCDCKVSEADIADMIILPGGLPGVTNLAADDNVISLVKKHFDNDKYVAAICAAPSVLGQMGILNGKKAVCYPGFEDKLTGAEVDDCGTLTDGLVTTARAAGSAIDFALELVRLLCGIDAAEKIRKGIYYGE